MDLVDLARLRQEYAATGLSEHDAPADPLALFQRWLRDAVDCEIAEANAMAVSSVGADGAPTSRLVLCKQADARGFVFFTNYESQKARQLAANPRVSLLFPWQLVGRQVRVVGTASRVDPAESAAYFASRPRGAQLSAWASEQSRRVPARAVLEDRVEALEREYAGRDVPCPPHWGGIRVAPSAIEFWQGRADRLHDRLVYRHAEGDTWSIERLQP